MRIRLDAPPNTYEAVLVPASNDELIFEREDIRHHDFPYGGSYSRGSRETRLHEPATLATGRAAATVVELMRGCRVYHFHDTSRNAPVKQLVPTADNLMLRNDAGNLPAVLLALSDSDDQADQAAYKRIVGVIRQVAPFFRNFVLRPEKNDRLRLRWRQNDSDAVFSADQMSDGTLRFICLATLLLHPRPPSLVVLDEPELGLHPYAVVQLAGLLRQASTRSQVLVATQSATLMNQFELDDLIVVERVGGASEFIRPDRERLGLWLDECSLGELWEKNLIGGPAGRADVTGAFRRIHLLVEGQTEDLPTSWASSSAPNSLTGSATTSGPPAGRSWSTTAPPPRRRSGCSTTARGTSRRSTDRWRSRTWAWHACARSARTWTAGCARSKSERSGTRR